MSKDITNLMVLLKNSKGSKEALEKRISDKVVLDSYGASKDDSATKTSSTSSNPESAANPLTKKELKK